DDAVMPVEQGPECAAGADRTELAVIADHDHLGLGQVAGGQEAEHVAVVGYPGLVEHDDVPPSELQGAVVEAPQERGDRTALGEVGFAAEGPGGLSGGGGPDDFVAGGDVGLGGAADRRRLPGAGDPEDQRAPSSLPADAADRL